MFSGACTSCNYKLNFLLFYRSIVEFRDHVKKTDFARIYAYNYILCIDPLIKPSWFTI